MSFQYCRILSLGPCARARLVQRVGAACSRNFRGHACVESAASLSRCFVSASVSWSIAVDVRPQESSTTRRPPCCCFDSASRNSYCSSSVLFERRAAIAPRCASSRSSASHCLCRLICFSLARLASRAERLETQTSASCALRSAFSFLFSAASFRFSAADFRFSASASRSA